MSNFLRIVFNVKMQGRKLSIFVSFWESFIQPGKNLLPVKQILPDRVDLSVEEDLCRKANRKSQNLSPLQKKKKKKKKKKMRNTSKFHSP